MNVVSTPRPNLSQTLAFGILVNASKFYGEITLSVEALDLLVVLECKVGVSGLADWVCSY